ncbi:OmpA family protein [uncultured Microscilla sp.]|uniref:OmpA family protein n=1 Tax=uncultured Microscilla sp. TaxID=432653 RepID=UPI00260614E2|nr:OmpA family protein [uncultured Microscilla sp.]
MKKGVLLIIILMCSMWVQAQRTRLRKANVEFAKFNYKEAIKLYETYLAKNPSNKEAQANLAHSYRKVNDSKNAEKWYAVVVNHPNTNPTNKLYYAQALAMNGRYKESRKWYKIYAKEVGHDERGHVFEQTYQNLAQFYEDASKYEVRLAPFNSKKADFSPMFYRNGIVFCSSREPDEDKRKDKKEKHGWNGDRFLDLYYTRGGVTSPEPFHKDLNSRYHEGPLSFYNGENSVVFTRNNYYNGKFKKSKEGINKLKLYLATIVSDKFAEITEFPYNDDEYSVGHPTLSSDGTTLYFVSDMPGSLGGTDIFKSTLQAGQWGPPQNLGSGINTKGNEMFPFLDADNNLFFASNGHAGLGGLDIFLARNINGHFAPPENLGAPVNSSKDDFGFIMDTDKNEGYFSSNRDGGVGDDDIYYFKLHPCKIAAVVVDSVTGRMIDRAHLEIHEEDTKKQVIHVNASKYLFTLQTKIRTNYLITASKEGYVPKTIEITHQQLIDCKNQDRKIVDTIKIALGPPIIARKTGKPSRGGNILRTPPGRGWDSTKIIQVKTIYYDLDKYFIRPDAVKTLDELLVILYRNPKMRIGLSSHTDSRNTSKYNVQLSQRRSQSALQYLVSRGISPQRIIVDWFGETKLVTPCPDGVPCNETQHQLNRRTEVIVLEE